MTFDSDYREAIVIETTKHVRLWIVWKLDWEESRKAKRNIGEMFAICTTEAMAKEYLDYLTKSDVLNRYSPKAFDFEKCLKEKKGTGGLRFGAYIERTLGNHMLGGECIERLDAIHQSKELEHIADHKDE